MLHLGLEGITEVDTDPEGRFVSLKVTTCNDSSLFVPLRGIARGNNWLEGASLKGYKIICKKNEGNENKIILGDLNCTMDKIDKDSENKTQRLYRCSSNYALSKLIVDNGLEDLGEGRTQIPLSSPATIGSLQGSTIDWVYTDIKIANNIKINHIMVSFTNHYNAISIERLPSKTFLFVFSIKNTKKQVQLQWALGI